VSSLRRRRDPAPQLAGSPVVVGRGRSQRSTPATLDDPAGGGQEVRGRPGRVPGGAGVGVGGRLDRLGGPGRGRGGLLPDAGPLRRRERGPVPRRTAILCARLTARRTGAWTFRAAVPRRRYCRDLPAGAQLGQGQVGGQPAAAVVEMGLPWASTESREATA